MDESLLDFENELKRLRPRAPSVRLHRQIEAVLEAPVTPSRLSRDLVPSLPEAWFRWDWRTVVAAAAAVALSAAWISMNQRTRRDSDSVRSQVVVAGEAVVPTAPLRSTKTNLVESAPGLDRYQPVGAASVLYDLKEDSVVTTPSSLPARRLRYRYVDTYTWRNPATNASLKWSLPRDEVRVLPVSLH